jgi:hypothetical protein
MMAWSHAPCGRAARLVIAKALTQKRLVGHNPSSSRHGLSHPWVRAALGSAIPALPAA